MVRTSDEGPCRSAAAVTGALSDVRSDVEAEEAKQVFLTMSWFDDAAGSGSVSDALERCLPSGFVDAVTSVFGGPRSDRSSFHGRVARVAIDRLAAVRSAAERGSWEVASLGDPLAAVWCREALDEMPAAMWMGVFLSAVERRLVNMTPHEINIRNHAGRCERAYPPSGVIARAEQTVLPLGSVNGVGLTAHRYGPPVLVDADGVQVDAPPWCVDIGTACVVSQIAGSALLQAGCEQLLLVPLDLVHDAGGMIVGAHQFACAERFDMKRRAPLPVGDVEVSLDNRLGCELTVVDGVSGKVEMIVESHLDRRVDVPRVDRRFAVVHGVDVVSVSYGEPAGFPDCSDGVFRVVSPHVAEVLLRCDPSRRDLLTPGEPVRDARGRIVAVSGLLLAS